MVNPPVDPESNLVEQHFAVVFTHNRRRNRFPENCVELKDSREGALTQADPGKSLHPARVFGPSRSSEGFRLYYLLEWL